MAQDNLLIFQVCRNAWIWANRTAIAAGLVNVPGDYFQNQSEYLAHEARPHGWKYINPDQDVKSKLNAINGGLTSMPRVTAEDGLDAEEVAREQAEYERKVQEYREGLSDPKPINNRSSSKQQEEDEA